MTLDETSHSPADKDTLGQWLASTRTRLLHRIELMLGPGGRRVGSAEDFFGALSARILDSAASLRVADEAHFMRLATKMARNLIIDQAKRPRVQRFDSLGSAVVHGLGARSSIASPLRGAIKDEDRELVLEALEMLSDDHRTAIELRDFQELSFQELGERLGRNENAAQLLHTRAVVKLGLALRSLMRP